MDVLGGIQRRFHVDSTWIPPRVGTCAGVKAVAWSPDGRKLATGGAGSSGGISGGVKTSSLSPQWGFLVAMSLAMSLATQV